VARSLAVHVLGVFSVSLDGTAVADAVWRRASAKALVKLLALAPGHRMHREQVYESLWEGIDGAAAAPRFRKALHFARKALVQRRRSP
jgi:DNA-binding SARP family transcriptional activator